MYKIAQVEVQYKLELNALFRYNKESTLMEGRVNSRRKVRGKRTKRMSLNRISRPIGLCRSLR